MPLVHTKKEENDKELSLEPHVSQYTRLGAPKKRSVYKHKTLGSILRITKILNIIDAQKWYYFLCIFINSFDKQ